MKYLLSLILLLTFLPILNSAQTKLESQEKAKTPEELKAEADSSFLDAIETGDAPGFDSLLESGADIDAKNKYGTSALMLAAFYKRSEFLVTLISRGADVNAISNFGNTALINAVSSNHVEMVKELLIAGANANAKSLNGKTALEFVLKSANPEKESNRRIIELLVSYGAIERD